MEFHMLAKVFDSLKDLPVVGLQDIPFSLNVHEGIFYAAPFQTLILLMQ